MVNVLGPEVLEQKVLGPKVLETTNDVFDPSGGTTFVCGVCRLQDYRLREETFQSFPKLLKRAGDSLSVLEQLLKQQLSDSSKDKHFPPFLHCECKRAK